MAAHGGVFLKKSHMAIEQEYAGLETEFRKAGVHLSLSEDHSKLRVRAADAVNWFLVPPLVEANHSRLPGWFVAGIWDAMYLRNLQELPDAMWLRGWEFTHDAGIWRLTIGEGQQLVYSTSTGRLAIHTHSDESIKHTGIFPAKSIFHVQKTFEENGWFNGESRVESLDIEAFLLR